MGPPFLHRARNARVSAAGALSAARTAFAPALARAARLVTAAAKIGEAHPDLGQSVVQPQGGVRNGIPTVCPRQLEATEW